MVLQEELVQLSKELTSLEKRIDTRQPDYKIWYSLWLDMVGALYSLFKAYPLLTDVYREHSAIKDDAIKILELIKLNRKKEDKNHDAWFDGHYLNNAEFRISLALHCLLKTCYPCNWKHGGEYKEDIISVTELAKDIFESKECSSCEKTPIPINNRCKKILGDFRDYSDAINGRPDTTGKYLKAVHFRVNSLKHTLAPEEDVKPTRKRMEKAWKGLLGIYELFSYIAKRRGALTSHN